MKNVMLVSAMVLVAGSVFGQSLQKGNLVGVHVGAINLSAGATMSQYTEFFVNTYAPAYEKNFGAKIYLAKAIRGEDINSFSVIVIYSSEKIRDKYFNADGTVTDLGKGASEKMKSLTEKLDKLGTSPTPKYTDWIVQ